MSSQDFQKPILHVRFVTKGTNIQQIIESLYDMQQTVNDKLLNSRAEWHIEVVTDNYIDLGVVNKNVVQIVVP